MRDKALRLRWFHFCFFRHRAYVDQSLVDPSHWLPSIRHSIRKKLPLAPVIVSHACDYHPGSLRRHSSTINSMRVHDLVA